MDTLVERCGGLDVHRDSVAACVRVPGKGRQRDQHAESFGTTASELARLREWLVGLDVTRVGMESTGDYWNPVVRHEAPFDRGEVEGLTLRAVAAAR